MNWLLGLIVVGAAGLGLLLVYSILLSRRVLRLSVQLGELVSQVDQAVELLAQVQLPGDEFSDGAAARECEDHSPERRKMSSRGS